jgi:hypothetical protein
LKDFCTGQGYTVRETVEKRYNKKIPIMGIERH